jgi:hypothetical protein
VQKFGFDLAQVGRLDVAVRPTPGAGPIEVKQALTNTLQHDNEQHCCHNTHVIDTEPRMNAIHSREFLQESAGCQYWQGFQTAAFSMLYGARPAYTARSPSTLRLAIQKARTWSSIPTSLFRVAFLGTPTTHGLIFSLSKGFRMRGITSANL